MTKYICNCGRSNILHKYFIHLEGTLTFRDYYGECGECKKLIEVRDLDENDIIEQEYLC